MESHFFAAYKQDKVHCSCCLSASLIAVYAVKIYPTRGPAMNFAHLSNVTESKVGFPLDCAARILPIASAIAVSVIVEPNRSSFFSNGSAK